MNLLLVFLASCVAMALWAARRRDELPQTRSVLLLILVVSTGYLSRRFI